MSYNQQRICDIISPKCVGGGNDFPLSGGLTAVRLEYDNKNIISKVYIKKKNILESTFVVVSM